MIVDISAALMLHIVHIMGQVKVLVRDVDVSTSDSPGDRQCDEVQAHSSRSIGSK